MQNLFILKEKIKINEWITEYLIRLNGLVKLESGIEVQGLELKFRKYGKLNSSKSNAVMIFHPLSFGLKGFALPDQDKSWWTKIAGSGKCLDIDKYCLILGSVNFIAEQVKKVSPPKNRLFLTFDDAARIQKNIIDYLGISELYAVTGGSYGAMAALAFSVNFKWSVKHTIVISATHKACINQIMIRNVQAKLLDFMLTNSADTKNIVGLVKLIVLLHYRKNSVYESFLNTEADVSGYLDQCCEKMSAYIDLRLYMNALKMMDHFDVSEKIEKGLSNFHIWAASSDNMYTIEQHKKFHDYVKRLGINSHFAVIESDKGHDTFLMDEEKLIPYFERVLV